MRSTRLPLRRASATRPRTPSDLIDGPCVRLRATLWSIQEVHPRGRITGTTVGGTPCPHAAAGAPRDGRSGAVVLSVLRIGPHATDSSVGGRSHLCAPVSDHRAVRSGIDPIAAVAQAVPRWVG